MALPNLSPEQRAQALEKAARVRQERAALKDDLKSGKRKLSDVLEHAKDDDIIGKLKVSALLTSLPGVGKAKAEKAMEQIGIAENRRLAGLGPVQIKKLLEHFE